MTISMDTAERLMNIVAFAAVQSAIELGEEFDLEAIEEFARDMFVRYCEAEGITEVEDE